MEEKLISSDNYNDYSGSQGPLRSNFDSHESNRRESFWFLGRNSAPRRRIGARIDGNESYRPPGPF